MSGTLQKNGTLNEIERLGGSNYLRNRPEPNGTVVGKERPRKPGGPEV